MPVFFESFFTLVRSHFMSLSFLSAWHLLLIFKNETILNYFGTLFKNALAGLNAGILCSGIIIEVFFEILRAIF